MVAPPEAVHAAAAWARHIVATAYAVDTAAEVAVFGDGAAAAAAPGAVVDTCHLSEAGRKCRWP